jgi:hypothetical protein
MCKYWSGMLVVAATLFAVACSSPPPPAVPPTALPTVDPVYRSDGGGEPRSATYWALWNACAEENRADVARANGGRAAGWILMDDLLEDPGIQLGDHPVTTCQEGLALLRGRTTAGKETGDPIYGLAAALLAAELNLNAGAETCPIAEEAVLGGHLVLARVGFDGRGETAATSGEIADAVPRLVELLVAYNSGALCR